MIVVLKWCVSFGLLKAFVSDGGMPLTRQVVCHDFGVVKHFNVCVCIY